MLSITEQTTLPQNVSSPGVPTLFFISFTLTADTTLAAQPAFQIDLPAVPAAGASYYLAYFDPDEGWQLALEGPATISGSTLNFVAPSGPIDWGPNETYWYALYAVGSSSSG
jgi:hypothetical protein